MPTSLGKLVGISTSLTVVDGVVVVEGGASWRGVRRRGEGGRRKEEAKGKRRRAVV